MTERVMIAGITGMKLRKLMNEILYIRVVSFKASIDGSNKTIDWTRELPVIVLGPNEEDKVLIRIDDISTLKVRNTSQLICLLQNLFDLMRTKITIKRVDFVYLDMQDNILTAKL